VSAGAEFDVADVQACQFRDSQSGLHGDVEQGSVSPCGPGVSIRSGQQSVDLGRVEEADLLVVAAFARDGEHPSDQRGMFGMPQCGVSEEGSDGCQPSVASADAVVAVRLEVVQECANDLGVELSLDPPRGPAGNL
jgi:hypothetical protein